MILKVFSVRDNASEAFLPPFFARAKGEALRMFEGACRDEKHQFFQHREDYVLFECGEWDDQSGLFVLLPSPVRMISAMEFVSQ